MILSNYIYRLGLPGLEKKGKHWNFKCVVCGDSKKSKDKKRGWILEGKNIVYCHNCGYSKSFVNFLKEYYHHIYLDYLKESVMDNNQNDSSIKEPKKSEKRVIFPIDNMISVYNLPDNHICKKYINKRKIPFKVQSLLFYCENFQKECNKLFPDKFEKYPNEDKRLLIPFFDKNKKISYIQGRTLTGNFLRYITLELFSELPKIYGLDRVNKSKRIYVVEGPIDSLFVDNCLAMGSASIDINALLSISNKENFVFVFDLDNRNKQIIKRIEKMIHLGFKVCLIPTKYKRYGKDINQFIENMFTKEEIKSIIDKNIFEGFNAKVQLKLWSKIL